MKKSYRERLGIFPIFMLGIGLLLLGLLTMSYVVDNWWPFDVTRLDLVRATAQGRVDAASLLEAANTQIIFAFLAGALIAATGLMLPIAYYINRRFRLTPGPVPPFLVVLRQSMWVGFFVAFCLWLQMNRTLGIAVAALVAAVLLLLEFLLQLRMRTANVTG